MSSHIDLVSRIRELEEENSLLADEISVLQRDQLTPRKKDQHGQEKAAVGVLAFCAGVIVGAFIL
jgi:hypothetical protein